MSGSEGEKKPETDGSLNVCGSLLMLMTSFGSSAEINRAESFGAAILMITLPTALRINAL